MATDPIDVTRDPLLTPMLALLMAAINADIGEIMVHDGGSSVNAVEATQLHPLDMENTADGQCRLSAYRIRSRPTRTTMQRIDHVATVQFDYISPSCSKEQLDARWPLLEHVWQKLVETIDNGYHEAYLDGEFALGNVIKLDLSTAQKIELFAPGSEYTFPAFRGQMDITWRGEETAEARTYYPALSFAVSLPRTESNDAEGRPIMEPEAESTRVVSYTPIGVDELNSEPFEEEAELQEEAL